MSYAAESAIIMKSIWHQAFYVSDVCRILFCLQDVDLSTRNAHPFGKDIVNERLLEFRKTICSFATLYQTAQSILLYGVVQGRMKY
jgi:hypothetical protein